MHIDLPGGETAELHDSVNLGQRNLLQQLNSDVVDAVYERFGTWEKWIELQAGMNWGSKITAAMQKYHQAGVCVLLKGWTLAEPLPTIDSIEEKMDALVYDVIRRECLPLMAKIIEGESFGPSGATDPKVDTAGSPDSGTSSEEAPTPTTSPTDTP